MSTLMYMLRRTRSTNFVPRPTQVSEILQILSFSSTEKTNEKPLSPRMQEFRDKLKAKPAFTKIEQIDTSMEKEPLIPWPDNTNPHTGEVGGPKGPEPTRYGDWERKGRVSDF